MTRPITKADAKFFKEHYSAKVFTNDVLGIYIRKPHGVFAYSVDRFGVPVWVSKRTIDLRKRIGHPKKRVKQMLRGDIFSLDEMELAERLIHG